MKLGHEYRVIGLPKESMLRTTIGFETISHKVEILDPTGDDEPSKIWIVVMKTDLEINPNGFGMQWSGWVVDGNEDTHKKTRFRVFRYDPTTDEAWFQTI